MNARVVPIATNTFREAVRDRVLYNLVAFAILMAGAAILVGQISINMERLVVINLGLALCRCSAWSSPSSSALALSPRKSRNVRCTPCSRAPCGAGSYCRQVSGLTGTLVGEQPVHGGRRLRRFDLCVGHHRYCGPTPTCSWPCTFIVLQFVMVTALALLFSSSLTPAFGGVCFSAYFSSELFPRTCAASLPCRRA